MKVKNRGNLDSFSIPSSLNSKRKAADTNIKKTKNCVETGYLKEKERSQFENDQDDAEDWNTISQSIEQMREAEKNGLSVIFRELVLEDRFVNKNKETCGLFDVESEFRPKEVSTPKKGVKFFNTTALLNDVSVQRDTAINTRSNQLDKTNDLFPNEDEPELVAPTVSTYESCSYLFQPPNEHSILSTLGTELEDVEEIAPVDAEYEGGFDTYSVQHSPNEALDVSSVESEFCPIQASTPKKGAFVKTKTTAVKIYTVLKDLSSSDSEFCPIQTSTPNKGAQVTPRTALSKNNPGLQDEVGQRGLTFNVENSTHNRLDEDNKSKRKEIIYRGVNDLQEKSALNNKTPSLQKQASISCRRKLFNNSIYVSRKDKLILSIDAVSIQEKADKERESKRLEEECLLNIQEETATHDITLNAQQKANVAAGKRMKQSYYSEDGIIHGDSVSQAENLSFQEKTNTKCLTKRQKSNNASKKRKIASSGEALTAHEETNKVMKSRKKRYKFSGHADLQEKCVLNHKTMSVLQKTNDNMKRKTNRNENLANFDIEEQSHYDSETFSVQKNRNEKTMIMMKQNDCLTLTHLPLVDESPFVQERSTNRMGQIINLEDAATEKETVLYADASFIENEMNTNTKNKINQNNHFVHVEMEEELATSSEVLPVQKKTNKTAKGMIKSKIHLKAVLGRRSLAVGNKVPSVQENRKNNKNIRRSRNLDSEFFGMQGQSVAEEEINENIESRREPQSDSERNFTRVSKKRSGIQRKAVDKIQLRKYQEMIKKIPICDIILTKGHFPLQ